MIGRILETFSEKKLFQKHILKKLIPYWPIILIFFVYTIIFSLYLIFRYNSFQSEYYDLGLQVYSINSALKNASGIWSLIFPTNNSLIGHLNPIFLLILPLYAIISDPTVLLILTSIALGASIFPLFLLANNHLKNRKKALLVCIIYIINPLFHNSNRYDFHLITFVPFFVFSAIYFYEKKNIFGFLFLSLLANATHEFVCILTSGMALSLLIREFRMCQSKNGEVVKKTGIIKASIALTIIGILWFIIALYIQASSDPATPLTNWLSFGNVQNSQLPQKAMYLLQMFLPLLFLPILEPIFLLPVLPYIAVILISNHPGYWSIIFQYGAFTTPFLFYAVILALRKFQIRAIKSTHKTIKTILILLLISNLAFSITFSSLSPLSPDSWSHVTEHDLLLQSLINEVPKNSSVLTHGQVYPHVANRLEVALYKNDYKMPGRIIDYYPDFIIFDVTKSSFYSTTKLFGLPDNETIPLSKNVHELISGGDYGLYSACDGAYVFQKKNNTVSAVNKRANLLQVDEKWVIRGIFEEIPYGVSIKGEEGVYSLFYNNEYVIEGNSFSLSYGIKTQKSYGLDSWAGIIIGYENENNYRCLYLRYPGGHVNLIEVVNGTAKDTVVGSIPYPSENYQYFYVRVKGNQLEIYVNSLPIAKLTLNSSEIKGYVGCANWQQDTNIQFLLLTQR